MLVPIDNLSAFVRLLERVLKVLGWLTTSEWQGSGARLKHCLKHVLDLAGHSDPLSCSRCCPTCQSEVGQPPQHLQDVLQEAEKGHEVVDGDQ